MAKVIIIAGYGINCEEESKHAFELAGAEANIVHINDLIAKKDSLENYQILMFPGGFSYGDDTFSGNAFANRVKNNLWNELQEFIQAGKLILGVCNGFQVMTNLGLFSTDGKEYGKRVNALVANETNRYECRWANIAIDQTTNCVFTKGLTQNDMPIAHGEGNFYCTDEMLQTLKANNQVVFRYVHSDGTAANREFPTNPNGAIDDIAGICDKSGKILGLMPHPERALYTINRPDFHQMKEEYKREGKELAELYMPNLTIFKNAVNYVKENLVNNK